jgi:hypothetical protein
LGTKQKPTKPLKVGHQYENKLRIPLDFKQTVMAALETPPEPKKQAKKKKPKRS